LQNRFDSIFRCISINLGLVIDKPFKLLCYGKLEVSKGQPLAELVSNPIRNESNPQANSLGDDPLLGSRVMKVKERAVFGVACSWQRLALAVSRF
jgi:hypothetical protein